MQRRSNWLLGTFYIWTIFVWGVVRVRNIVGDTTLDGAERTWLMLLAASLALPSVVLGVTLIGRIRATARDKATPPLLKFGTLALAAWTTIVWVWKAIDIVFLSDHETAFVLVHLMLAVVSIVLALGASNAVLRRRGRDALSKSLTYVYLGALSLLILFPIYMLILRALSSPLRYISAGQPLHPVAIEWDVFARAFSKGHLGHAMLLSFLVTALIVIAQLITSTLAAYVFAFMDFPLKRTMFVVVVGTLLLPIEVTLIANIETIRNFGMLNSVQGLSLPFLASAIGIFLIRQGFLGIPGDLRDASTLDGYGHLRFMFKVAMPMSKPIIGSFVVISFLSAWNQYVWPRFATDRNAWQTVQVALRTIGSENPQELNMSFAAAILAALPLLVLLIFFQRQIVRGLTAGAVKG